MRVNLSKVTDGFLYPVCSKSKQKHTCIFQTISTSLSIFPGLNFQFKTDNKLYNFLFFLENAAKSFLKFFFFVNYCPTYNCDLIFDNQN